MRFLVFLSTNYWNIFRKTWTGEQQVPDNDNAIIRLPDEILLRILFFAVPSMGLEELRITANVSQKFRRISVDVLRRFMFPDIHLSTVIGQEGRRKFTTVYQFHSFDESTLMTTFKPESCRVPRRVRGRSYAALPVMYELSMTAAVGNRIRPSSLLQSPIGQQSGEHPRYTIKHGPLSSTSTTRRHHFDGKIKICPKSLRIAKPGEHVSGSSQKMRDGIRLWQLHYAVNFAEDSEDCYIEPTAVRVHLSLLARTFATNSQNSVPKKRLKIRQRMDQGNDNSAAAAAAAAEDSPLNGPPKIQ